MCTITYLPTATDAFILTSNRDESGLRPTRAPAIEDRGSLKLVYPKDLLAGGTWVCISNRNRAACLMNGAFEKHERKPPYRKSRGLVLLDLFDYESVSDFLSGYDFEGIEPFTIIVYDRLAMTEFRWDGTRKHTRAVDTGKPHIWSSASLYSIAVREKRERWFRKWLAERKNFDRDEILRFHRFGGEGDRENDFVMNRQGVVQTVSITSIVKNAEGAIMRYHDLMESRISETGIDFSRESRIAEPQ